MKRLTPSVMTVAALAAGLAVLADASTTSVAAPNPVQPRQPEAFPDGGYENVKDQFLMGDDLLVAPLVTKGAARSVQIPPGTWKADDGALITGPVQKAFSVPLGRLLYFERQ
jgi:hypothetical protein